MRSLIIVTMCLAGASSAIAQSFTLPQTVSGGAGPSSGGAYTLVSTAGEAGTGGPLANGQYSVVGGFWGGPGIAAAPVMSLDRSVLVFGASTNGTAFVQQTPSQTLRLTQSGAGTVTWTAASNQPWLTITPSSGTGPAVLTISLSFVAGLLPTQTAAISLAFSGAGNTAGPIQVRLNTFAQGATAAPFGSFDTPADGTAGITGSFAVTGWALDDIAVTGVRILRNPVAGETPGQLVFIGNATFVTGARPDVATIFPATPLFDRAGWGYLLLSNFLPNSGNGTVTLVAIADDIEGHSTVLGSKTITCTNLSATAPFGAIDTPGQGDTIGGPAFVNFGWVLAAQPTASGLFIPFDGSTIEVFVDSVSIGKVDSYNNARPDIQALFPGYANTDGAVGIKFIDTTALANGVHTIFWIAIDNVGATAGIGSRFFTVSNNGTAVVAVAERSSAEAIEAAITIRRGFDPNAEPEVVVPGDDGVLRVRTPPLDRVTLDLDPRHTSAEYRGYEQEGGETRPLPIGTHLDPRTGEFAWAPAPGFGGTHHLVFVRSIDGREERIRVDVTVGSRVK